MLLCNAGGSPCGIWDEVSPMSSGDSGHKSLRPYDSEKPPPHPPAAASIRAALARLKRPQFSRNDGDLPKNLMSIFDSIDASRNGAHSVAQRCMWALDTRCALLTASADGFIAGLADIDRQRVSRFRLEKDRLHSLVSILLQRRLIRSTFNVEDSQYSILRTSENKPYLCLGDRNGDRGSWNFNVSHHGHFVCICSHPTALIGVDIVEIKMRSSWTRGVPAYIGMFQGKQFSAREISNMLQQRDPLVHFFINWSMKESFIKAVGTGLYFDLVSVEFMISYDECYTGSELITGTAQLSINGVPRLDWELVFRSLDHAHIISVATGPLADAADSYRHAILPHAKLHGSTFRVCAFDEKCSSSPDSNNHTSFLEFLTTSQLNQ